MATHGVYVNKNSISPSPRYAHRLSIVMDRGKLVGRGTHRELLTRDGHYVHLWKLQLQEREEEEQRLKAVGNGLASTT